MKSKFYLAILLAFSVMVWGCHSPEELIPPVENDGLNSFRAYLLDEDGNDINDEGFPGEIDHETGKITVVIPYYYPQTSDNRVTSEDIKSMRVEASLDHNVTITPGLYKMDLTVENHITVSNKSGITKNYTVTGEIRELWDSYILGFNVPDANLEGIIDQNAGTIALSTLDDIGSLTAEYTLSPHATISPDPAATAVNFDDPELTFTVTAQNGVDKTTYTVIKKDPDKIQFGMREGSAQIMWVKNTESDLGINLPDVTGGFAVHGDYLVFNTRNQPATVINRFTGDLVGPMNISSIMGNLTNFYVTSDDDDNMLWSNLTNTDNQTFHIWKMSEIDGTLESIIEWENPDVLSLGRKFSVRGSVDGNAIISAPVYGSTARFVRWQVINGVIGAPEVIDLEGVGSWGTNADIVYTVPTNPTSDYFLVSYSHTPRNMWAWIDGMTNTPKASIGTEESANFVPNAVDYVNFNGLGYVAMNYVNGYTWGTADYAYVLDANNVDLFTGSYMANVPAVIWMSEGGIYGSSIDRGGNNKNINYLSDVKFKVSDDGYYLDFYFFFGNGGSVVNVRFDCIDK